jgi:hypothetical protein
MILDEYFTLFEADLWTNSAGAELKCMVNSEKLFA